MIFTFSRRVSFWVMRRKPVGSHPTIISEKPTSRYVYEYSFNMGGILRPSQQLGLHNICTYYVVGLNPFGEIIKWKGLR